MEQITEGVWVRRSDFCQSNAVVVQGRDGVLLVDPGIEELEVVALADELDRLGQRVVVGFSTHPHWDHLLWHDRLGNARRFGTARCATAIQARLSTPGWKEMVASMMPSELVDRVSLQGFGDIEALPDGQDHVPWDGPIVRIIEHDAHAAGHAALLIEERGVLIAGDMLSDVLVPILDQRTTDPVEDYLAALQLLEDAARGGELVIPGHGCVGPSDDLPTRIARDRDYVIALRDGLEPVDPRIGSGATYAWVADVHRKQRAHLANLSAT